MIKFCRVLLVLFSMMGVFQAHLHAAKAIEGTATEKEEAIFSTKGKILEILPQKKSIRLRSEVGLTLSFRIVATTEFQEGEKPKLFADLAVGDDVEIEYTYDPNYEKVARLIRMEAEKKPAQEARNAASL